MDEGDVTLVIRLPCGEVVMRHLLATSKRHIVNRRERLRVHDLTERFVAHGIAR